MRPRGAALCASVAVVARLAVGLFRIPALVVGLSVDGATGFAR